MSIFSTPKIPKVTASKESVLPQQAEMASDLAVKRAKMFGLASTRKTGPTGILGGSSDVAKTTALGG